ncbi:DUF2225 domain-containing protein [Anaerosporobacter sp.]|uniref:DUF2225 domain-containing protein n=1 Tax=Anaerosporobacter sp. TaxID=1872529 RepID=UPI00286F2FD9|nr:DUF2225 domain-containing protein [Anaerosporobacter sp.]
MANIFSGLENFGLGELKDLDIYNTGSTDKKDSDKEADKPKITEADLVFDKTYTCPVCDNEFKAKAVKTGKVKLLGADSDLRPKYQLVDSLKYDAVVCPGCGYSALNRFFTYMTAPQAKLIKEQITVNFRGIEDSGEIYTYDDAIARHKLVLVNTIVKKAKNSERAYTCLKIAWLLRGKIETLPTDTADYNTEVAKLRAEEDEFIKNAYEGFTAAFSKEVFPMCGMDENTVTYLVADLARRCGKFDEAGRWISKVLVSRDANERIKSKARDLKDLIVQGKKDNA